MLESGRLRENHCSQFRGDMMRIGYLTLGSEANFLDRNSFDLSWGIRVPLIKSLQHQDIEVVILSPMSRVDERYKKYKTLRKPPEWFQKLEYRFKPEFEKSDLEDLDLLFIECGSTNTTMGRDGISYFEVVTNALKVWEGNVIYYQHSPVLYYPFGEYFSDKPIKNISDKNLRVQVKKARIFENKEWLVIHHARNENKWIEQMYCRNSMRYKDVKDRVGDQLEFKYIPLPYDLREEKRYSPACGEKWDSIFIGGRYSSSSMNYARNKTDRYPILKRFFYRSSFRHAIIGKFWDNVKDLNVLGPIGKPYDVTRLYNWSLVGLWTDSEFVLETEFWITRYIFILMGGNLLVADTSHTLACDYVNKEFHVSNQKDLEELIDWYKDLSTEEKEEIRIKQEKRFPSWFDIDWKRIFNY